MTLEELKEYENKFLEVCKHICSLFYITLEERTNQFRRFDIGYRNFISNIGLIKFKNRAIRMNLIRFTSKVVCISFYGKNRTGGPLKIYFDLSRNSMVIKIERFLPYPMVGEILKIIMDKYELDSTEDLDQFISKIRDKDIELV